MQSSLLVAIIAVALGATVIGLHRLHLHNQVKKNLKERASDNFLTFLEHFKSRKIHNKVLTVVYDNLSRSTMAKVMPVRPCDDLRKVWGFDDDLDDLVIDLQRELAITAKEINQEMVIKRLNTVEDLVVYLSEMVNNC